MLNWNEYRIIQKQCYQLGQEKNLEYGCESLKLFGGVAILSRMNDKIQRLNNHEEQIGIKNMENNLKIESDIMDLINYSIYLIMLMRKKLEGKDER